MRHRLLTENSTAGGRRCGRPRPASDAGAPARSTSHHRSEPQVHQGRPGHCRSERCWRSSFKRICRDATGMSFPAWRQRLRLFQVAEMLTTGTPVTTVALNLGYDSPSAFTAMFRRHFGVTPSRFASLRDDASSYRELFGDVITNGLVGPSRTFDVKSFRHDKPSSQKQGFRQTRRNASANRRA
ncbi:helix-turn-helix transcriptional regulator [Azospirillum doebereinerae]|uniref:helix-turn-helix transcriptional regulator n=1 Tax=Azospirillum doebereinerae TaxID=92933 RepID=UPI0030842BF2